MFTKHLTHPNLLYFFAKLNGFIPFSLSRNPIVAGPSTLCLIYSISILLIRFSLLILYQISDLSTVMLNNRGDKQTVLFVAMAERIMCSCRIVIIHLLQIWNRKYYINIINDGFKLYNDIWKLFKIENRFIKFFDKKCQKVGTLKMILSIIQIIIILITIISIPSLIFHNVNFILINYTNFTTMVVSGMFFAGMLVALQFYRSLNQHLINSFHMIETVGEDKFNHLKISVYYNVNHDLDRIAKLYDRIILFTSNVNSIYRQQLLFTILESFILILCQVYIVCLFSLNLLKILLILRVYSYFSCMTMWLK